MRNLFRSLGIMITVLAVAGVFAGCAQRRPPAGPVPPLPPLVATPEDRNIVVATVNGAEITRYTLIGMMNQISATNERASFSEPREETRKKALDRLIFQELALQETRRRGLSLEEGALDRGLGRIKANLGGEEAYKKFLAEQGLSEGELRSQVERLLLLELIVSQEVIRNVAVTEADVRKEYERQKGLLIIPEKVSVEDVIIFLNPGEPASMARAREILARINADKDKDPANLASDGTFIVHRIDLDKDQDPALYAAARKLREGELSGVITTGDSLHIIRLTGYQPEKQKPYEEVKDSLEAQLRTAAQKKRRQTWVRELKKDAKIEILGPEGRKRN